MAGGLLEGEAIQKERIEETVTRLGGIQWIGNTTIQTLLFLQMYISKWLLYVTRHCQNSWWTKECLILLYIENFMKQNLWLAVRRFSFWYWKLGGPVKKTTLYKTNFVWWYGFTAVQIKNLYQHIYWEWRFKSVFELKKLSAIGQCGGPCRPCWCFRHSVPLPLVWSTLHTSQLMRVMKITIFI